MKKFNRTILLFLAISLVCTVKTYGQDAVSILWKVDKVIFAPKDKQGNVKMILKDKSGNEKIREAIMMQKGIDKKLYRYTKPESQVGIATLSLPGDETWLYMPAFGKPRKIDLLTRSQAFTGTDFSYEDMEPRTYSDRFIPKLLEVRETEYVLDLIPKSAQSEYSRVIAHIHKVNSYPILLEYFDKQKKKIKEATYEYEKIGPYWNAREVTMTDLRKGHSTRTIMTDVKFDQGLGDDLFTVEKLKQ
ncbi:MAG: outer membrane lipoprotein-sorting protein [Lentimicrobiaceae bacterium]|nr:outer membrane lipoprotein-sorting protein [Lentimicrobiaceae bacterium]